MFDLEAAIRDWKRRFARKGGSDGIVEELEQHLRDEFAQQLSKGGTAQQAWQATIEQFGDAGSIAYECAKIDQLNAVDFVSIGMIFAVTAFGSLALVAILIVERHQVLTNLTVGLAMIALAFGELFACGAALLAIYHAARITLFGTVSCNPLNRVVPLWARRISGMGWILMSVCFFLFGSIRVFVHGRLMLNHLVDNKAAFVVWSICLFAATAMFNSKQVSNRVALPFCVFSGGMALIQFLARSSLLVSLPVLSATVILTLMSAWAMHMQLRVERG